jgi:hypothetical protein
MSGWPALHPDDEAGETIRVHPSGHGPQEAAEPTPPPPSTDPAAVPAGQYPAAQYPAGQYPAAPYSAAPSYPPPAPRRSLAPLVMVTVMVMTVVAGAVTIVYLLTGDRSDRPAPAAVASAPPSASASASGAVDACVVGDWQNVRSALTDAERGVSLTTDKGEILRLRADGTGEADFGSGVTLKGKYGGVTAEVMYIGKITFRYSTAGGTLTYTDVQSDAREVVFRSGRIVSNERIAAEADSDSYTCSGDTMRVTSEGSDDEYRRR